MNAKVNNCQMVRSSLVGAGGGRETQVYFGVAYSRQNLCENNKEGSRGGDLALLLSV